MKAIYGIILGILIGIATTLVASSFAQETLTITTYEYTYLLGPHDVFELQETMEKMNALGAQGYRLHLESDGVYIFIREKILR